MFISWEWVSQQSAPANRDAFYGHIPVIVELQQTGPRNWLPPPESAIQRCALVVKCGAAPIDFAFTGNGASSASAQAMTHFWLFSGRTFSGP